MRSKAVMACIALGSNVGDRGGNILGLIHFMERNGGVRVEAISPLFETAPEGVVDQPVFLNAAAVVETRLEPLDLLALCKSAESAVGRVDRGRWGPREADADIIFYGNEVVDLPGLRIPHPFMHQRIFVLQPLMAIAPEFVHPEMKMSVREICDLLVRSRAST